MKYKRKDLLGLYELEGEEIEEILRQAEGMKKIFTRQVKKVPLLRGKMVVNVFYEPSTRTRTSFELAAKALSADVINISATTSSIVKQESLIDTAKTVEALNADIIVLRHNASGAPHFLSKKTSLSIINGGDGTHEHPTQALLDLYTIKEKKGKIKGLKVALVGDITHSRVSRSNIIGLNKLGAEVRVVGPSTLIPRKIEDLGCKVYNDLESGLNGVDVVYCLRIQFERQQERLFPSLEDYVRQYTVNELNIRYAKDGALVMHPGPINRGIELSYEVAYSPNSTIEEQVTNGVAVRMSVFSLLLGGRHGSSN